MIGSIFTAVRALMATVTVGADTLATLASATHNVAKVAEAQSEQWLLESLEDSDVSVEEFMRREPLRVRMEREAHEAKVAQRKARLAAPKE